MMIRTSFSRGFLGLICGTAAGIMFMTAAGGAITVGGPGDAALRSAIAAAQPGDTIEVNSHVLLQSPIRIDKPLTLRAAPTPALSETLEGTFAGVLFQIAADGVI